jgi:hypothetical protein
MGKENLGAAIEHLRRLLRGGAEAEAAVAYICGKYDILEPALRRWFEEVTDRTPEEYREVDRKVVSLDVAIAVEARKWIRNRFGPNLVGRRFVLEFDSREDPKTTVQRAYRYLGFTGYSVEAIEERTLRRVSLDGGPEAWSEIRKKVSRAEPYDRADQLEFAGEDEDLRARTGLLTTIRLMLLRDCEEGALHERADEVDERLRRAPTLTLLYQSLSPEERAELARRTNNPPVEVFVYEKGQGKSLLLEPQLEVLARLENGADVASPLHDRA